MPNLMLSPAFNLRTNAISLCFAGRSKGCRMDPHQISFVSTTSFMTNPPSRPQCAVEGER